VFTIYNVTIIEKPVLAVASTEHKA